MPTFSNSKVGIIIASYKDRDFLETCVNSIYRWTPRELFELIISSDVTDSVTDEYIRKLESDGWCKALFATERSWFTGTNNQGLQFALEQETPFSHFLLLNSDVAVLPGWLSHMLGDMYELDCGIMGCKTLTGDGKVDHAGAFSLGFHFGIRKGNNGYWLPRVCRPGKEWVTGACFLVRRDVLEAVGLLDEVQNPHIGSDRNYCYAAQEAGFKVGFSPATIYHFTLIHHAEKEGHDGTRGR